MRKWMLAVLSVLMAAAIPAVAHDDMYHTLQRNSWYLPTDDGQATIYVTSLGQGPKVVTLHGGFGANFEYMVRAVERHTAQRQFVFFDQRGSLLSPYKGNLEELTVEDLVADLEKLRKELGEEKMVLLAHSMGTRLAYEYLRQYPDRVSALILIGAFAPTAAASESLGSIEDRAKAMLARPVVKEELARAGLDNLSKDASSLARTQSRRLQFASVNIVHVERWREFEGGRIYYNGEAGSQLSASAPKDWDVSAFIAPRRIPISVIQGDRDYVDPGASGWAALRDAKAPLSSCIQVKVVKDGGHVAWLDDADGFAGMVDEALNLKGC